MLGFVAAALAGDGVGLTELPFASLAVPSGESNAAAISVRGPFRLVSVVNGVRSYEAALPVRPRALFFSSAPAGMTLKRGKSQLRFAAEPEDASEGGTWCFTPDAIVVRVKEDSPAPAGEFILTYKDARAREDALWRDSAGEAAGPEGDAAFVVRSAQVDDTTRRGLYLPVPSTATWDVDVPADGVLRMQPGILPPEIADGTRSDGATLTVSVNGAVEATFSLATRRFDDVRVPLGAYAGQRVRLGLATSDADPTRDHVFVGSPALYATSNAPRRALLVFVDTLRRDHLGVYGHTRGASPAIDAWANTGTVFEDARSVAPWTLPSSRAVLSGLQPEQWSDERSLPSKLSARGWATGAYVGNVYLSSNFEMAGGWGEHGCINWPYGRIEVDRALDFLDRHDDQDALLMVHLMDMHLPYKEPPAYRGLYEGEEPPGLGSSFNRNTLLSASRGNRDNVRDYLLARYDQNLRYVDDQVARLLSAVGPDATVVFFSDHGEEFFDHGELEHGHTLYDELLRIPLIVKAPGLTERRVTTPVSILDVTPTVLELLGLSAEGLDGHSLVAAARGQPDATLAARPIGFGRPLYGNEAWGSLVDGLKFISRAGDELVFDLTKDPGETSDIRSSVDPAPSRAAMATALGRESAIAYRLYPRGKSAGGLTVEVHVPGGIRDAWVGADPTNHSDATVEMLDADTVKATFKSGRAQREIFVVPVADAVQTAPLTSVLVRGGEPVFLDALPLDGAGLPLARVTAGGRTLEVTYMSTPLPGGRELVAVDNEQTSALEALGYLQPEDEGDAAPAGKAPRSQAP